MKNSNIKRSRGNQQLGFTIVEVLASLFIFSIIVISVGGIFVQVMRLERNTFAAQKIQENALRAFEMMAREIRVSRITTAQPANFCDISSLTMESTLENDTVVYALNDDGQITKNGSAITSEDVKFINLEFCLRGSGPDNESARVTILAKVAEKSNLNYYVNLETTITSRDISDDFEN